VSDDEYEQTLEIRRELAKAAESDAGRTGKMGHIAPPVDDRAAVAMPCFTCAKAGRNREAEITGYAVEWMAAFNRELSRRILLGGDSVKNAPLRISQHVLCDECYATWSQTRGEQARVASDKSLEALKRLRGNERHPADEEADRALVIKWLGSDLVTHIDEKRAAAKAKGGGRV
jgi:hypothetical protein